MQTAYLFYSFRSYIEYVPKPLRLPILTEMAAPVNTTEEEAQSPEVAGDSEDEIDSKTTLGRFMKYMEVETEHSDITHM